MLPNPPRGNESPADVYRLLYQLREELSDLEGTRIGGIEAHLRGMAQRLGRIEAQLHRIENKQQFGR